MTIRLHEIRECLESGTFDGTQALMVLDLPSMGIKECAAVPYDVARRMLEVLAKEFGMHLSADLERWQQAFSAAVEQGLTPCVKLEAVEQGGTIEVMGFDIEPAAKA